MINCTGKCNEKNRKKLNNCEIVFCDEAKLFSIRQVAEYVNPYTSFQRST